MFSGHWDHLGIGEADATGNKIYSGAYDNASGIAAIVGIGDVIAKMPKSSGQTLDRLLFPTAEEQGLLGAEYFATNPLFSLGKIAGNVSIDGVNFFGKTKVFSALGTKRSSARHICR
ncbi:MAG: M28 family peptidase [Acidobacteria bacterium]|nr:M28 family peptidase [Acidobacteriota bacterium]